MREVLTAGGIIVKDGKILLIKKDGSNSYSIPKGHIEEGETVEQAAIREMREETGYQTSITGHCGSLVRQSREETGEVVSKTIELFWMSVGKRLPGALDEISEWVDVGEASHRMFFPEEGEFLRTHLV